MQAKRAARENTAPETDTGPKLRVNEQITAAFVRLVFPEGGHQVQITTIDSTEMRHSTNSPVGALFLQIRAGYVAGKLRGKLSI